MSRKFCIVLFLSGDFKVRIVTSEISDEIRNANVEFEYFNSIGTLDSE